MRDFLRPSRYPPVMPLYRLTPRDETGEHPAWDRTTYWGTAFVHAATEAEARQAVDVAFKMAPGDDELGPWRDPALVAVEPDDWRGEKPGLVMVPWRGDDSGGLRVPAVEVGL